MASKFEKFFSEHIKIYPTTDKVEPFCMPGKVLRCSYPILLATIMVLNSCTPKTFNNSDDNNKTEYVDNSEYKKIYDEVVELYHIDKMKNQEPLSFDEVRQLLNSENIPTVFDSNYNHIPENNSNFWALVTKGVDIINHCDLTDAQRREYKKMACRMLSQITRKKGTNDIDIAAPNNIKAFMFFETVVHYDGSYSNVIDHPNKDREGYIDETKESYGRYYQDHEKLKEVASNYPYIRGFTDVLYNSCAHTFLSPEDSVQANKISWKILKDWLKNQDITDKNLWRFTDARYDVKCNQTFYEPTRGNRNYLELNVDPEGKHLVDSKFRYIPVGVTIIHEMVHVTQFKPGSNEIPEDNKISSQNFKRNFDNDLMELGPTLLTITLNDMIYKKIHNIESDQIVNYGYIVKGNMRINVGELAVWFANMMEKYPSKSIDEVLAKPEVMKKLNIWGKQSQQRTLSANNFCR